MPTPKKRKAYNVIYTDGSYMTYDLTVNEYEHIVERMEHKGIAQLSFGTIATEDIRSIVEFKEPKEEPRERELEDLGLPEMTNEQLEWMRQNIPGFYELERRVRH